MASKNPFGNLKINREDDDDDDMVVVNRKNSVSASNYQSNTEMKKKKKVRPEEKTQNQESVQEITEGFEVVGKQAKRPNTRRSNNEEGEEFKKENKKTHKGTGNNDRVYNKTRPQKRQYERHSGTGRGKETAKGGAGGRTVWGDNPEQIARQAKNSRDDYRKFIFKFFYFLNLLFCYFFQFIKIKFFFTENFFTKDIYLPIKYLISN